MSEYAIPPVSASTIDAQPKAQQTAVAPARVENSDVEQVARQAPPEDLQSQETSSTKRQASKALYTDVHLKFQVDDDTKEITVLILDRISKEVIRTIPPEELSNLRAGDLFELFM